MRRKLTPAEVAILADVVQRRAAGAARAAPLEPGVWSDGDARELGNLVTLELAEQGFDDDYKPTSYGQKLEDIIDALFVD